MNMKQMISHGIDLVDCRRIEQLVNRYGKRFLERVFTDQEQRASEDYRRRIERLSGRFAVKEAVMKLLGTGWGNGLSWLDVETRNDPLGRPVVTLTGRAQELARQRGIDRVEVSISHTSDYAVATAIALGKESD